VADGERGMILTREVIKDAAIGVGVADTPEGLGVLAKLGCAGVVWRRQVPGHVQAWLDALDPANMPSARLVLEPRMVPAALRHLGNSAGLPTGAERDWFEADVAELAGRFAALMATPYLRMRLDVVTTDACRKFHIDAITARLICTYRGPGTQYGISTDGADPKRVFQVATGAPFVLRGTLWPEKPASGLLHRSPPIAATGETRLVLVLDPMDTPEED
jgi:hypothetical protein